MKKAFIFMIGASTLVLLAAVVGADTAVEKAADIAIEEVEWVEQIELSDGEAGGTCTCNPAPASSGWTYDNDTCHLCTDSPACSSAKCEYKHNQHGGLKDVGCQWNSSSDADGVEGDDGDEGSTEAIK